MAPKIETGDSQNPRAATPPREGPPLPELGQARRAPHRPARSTIPLAQGFQTTPQLQTFRSTADHCEHG